MSPEIPFSHKPLSYNELWKTGKRAQLTPIYLPFLRAMSAKPAKAKRDSVAGSGMAAGPR